MKEEEAKQLVKKLCNAAFMAGEYSVNQDSLIFKAETKKALLISAEIVRHLTSAMHSDSDGCIHCDSGEEIPSAFDYCPYCNKNLRRR